jgi:hypothetical protein
VPGWPIAAGLQEAALHAADLQETGLQEAGLQVLGPVLCFCLVILFNNNRNRAF